MFPLKPKFRFPKGVSFWKRLELKEICRSTDLDAPGYRDIIAVSDKTGKNISFKSLWDSMAIQQHFSLNTLQRNPKLKIPKLKKPISVTSPTGFLLLKILLIYSVMLVLYFLSFPSL